MNLVKEQSTIKKDKPKKQTWEEPLEFHDLASCISDQYFQLKHAATVKDVLMIVMVGAQKDARVRHPNSPGVL